jgi:hypothetical protein
MRVNLLNPRNWHLLADAIQNLSQIANKRIDVIVVSLSY